MKKIKFFTLLMLLSIISIQSFASAVGDKFKHDGITYQITKLATTGSPGELAVYGTGNAASVNIPAQVADSTATNYNVVAVLNSAFRKKENITSVHLPETVRNIEVSAFEGCKGLTTINIPKALTVLDSYTFYGCESLQNITVDSGNANFEADGHVLYNKGKTKLLLYPAAKPGSSFTVPSSVKEIGANAFSQAKNLTDINLGSVQKLSDRAVRNCNNLTQISIPASVTNIEEGAILDCNKLTAFNVASGNAKYESVDGVLGEKNGSKLKLILFPPAKSANSSYTIPDKFTEIARMAFRKNQLQSITIPGHVTEIGPDAFHNSKKLTTITIQEGVKVIKHGAFNSCEKLTTVSIPASATTLGANIFFDCTLLEQVTVASSNHNYESSDGVVYTKNKTAIYCFPAGKKPAGDYTIPSSVKTIMFEAFRNSQWTGDLTIPSTVEKIEDKAFYLAQEKLTFSEGLKEIGKGAFAEMKNQTEVKLPVSVEKIGDNAFSGMQKLAKVEIPAGSHLTSMGSEVFANNPLLATATVGDNCALGELGKNAFKNNPKLTSFHVGKNSLTAIGEGAFSGCTALNSVVFDKPSKLTTIGQRAFDGAKSLTTFAIPNTVTAIKPSAFNGCSALATVTFEETPTIETIGNNAFQNSGLTSITIPESVKTIEKETFNSCHNLSEVTVPKGTTHVSAQSFIFCSTLDKINVDEANQKYKSIDGMLASKDGKKLLAFPPGRANAEYTRIPSLIEAIDSAFYSCYTLENITIPRNVTGIGDYSFSNCKKLKSVSFTGNPIPELKPHTFHNTNTRQITIYVRKKWKDDPNNSALLTEMKTKFKAVVPSFITTTGYDRGTEFFPTSMTAVGVIEFPEERTSVIIADEVKDELTNKIYKVRSVLDYAYEKAAKVKTIVFLGKLISVGIDAFKSNSISELYFVGDDAPSSAAADFGEPAHYPFNAAQKIYVKQTKVDAYKTAWAGAVENNIDYQIAMQTNSEGGTVCYPFDVKFAEGQGANDIKPYVAVNFDHANDTHSPFVRAYSVDDYYLPAFVGALIRSKGHQTATSYCQIDENQLHTMTTIATKGYDKNADNRMEGIVEDTAIHNEAGHQFYAFNKSKGYFVMLKDNTEFPYFKAYLRLARGASSPAKGFGIMFDDESTTTSIDGIADSSDAPYYNLSGMRVEKPAKGVYIRNGKKVIIK